VRLWGEKGWAGQEEAVEVTRTSMGAVDWGVAGATLRPGRGSPSVPWGMLDSTHPKMGSFFLS
jgi:hypothetical protein